MGRLMNKWKMRKILSYVDDDKANIFTEEKEGSFVFGD